MKIVLKKGQRLFFTSDTHYQHANICLGTTSWGKDENHFRDFQTLEHMNQVLVGNINEVVGEDDILIHLGDWSFGGFEMIKQFRDRIICKNIHLTYGNHDHHIRRNKEGIQEIFSSTQHYLFLNVRKPAEGGRMLKYDIVCMHFPISSWDGMGDGVIHLHGHTHLPKHLRTGEGRHMDVGVDGNGLKPISFEEIITTLKNKNRVNLVLPKDHHQKI